MKFSHVLSIILSVASVQTSMSSQSQTIGGYEVCLPKNTYFYFDNSLGLISTKGSDQPESTARLQIIMPNTHPTYTELIGISDISGNKGQINIVIRHYSFGAKAIQDRKEIELKSIINLEGDYKYFKKSTIRGNIIEIAPPYTNSNKTRFYFSSETDGTFNSWMSSCYFKNYSMGTCHVSDIYENNFYVEIDFPVEHRSKSKVIKSAVYSWLNTKVLKNSVNRHEN